VNACFDAEWIIMFVLGFICAEAALNLVYDAMQILLCTNVLYSLYP